MEFAKDIKMETIPAGTVYPVYDESREGLGLHMTKVRTMHWDDDCRKVKRGIAFHWYTVEEHTLFINAVYNSWDGVGRIEFMTTLNNAPGLNEWHVLGYGERSELPKDINV